MKKFYLLFLFYGVCFFAFSQTSPQKQMADYTYSFARNIEWPGQKDSYKIRVITQDRTLSNEFQAQASERKIDGKPIEVSFSSYVTIPQDVDILVVSSRFNATLQTIIERITGKPILIITDQSADQQYVMINFKPDPTGAVTFEFNRANMNNQGLRVLDGFDALGGTEINVARLYQQVRDSVRAMEQRSQAVRERIDSLNFQAAIALGIARNQNRTIEAQNEEIARRQVQLDRQSEVLDSLTIEFNNSQIKLDCLTVALDQRELELIQLGNEIIEQRNEVAKGTATLEEQNKLIKQRDAEIALRESRLQQLVTVVDSQEDTLVLLILFSVFLVVVLIFAYRAYQARRRDSKKLNQQKEELSDLLNELQSTQTQLVQSEKMASLGVLVAGIAHEINNAINYVYSGIHILATKFSYIRPVVSGLKNLSSEDPELQSKVERLVEHRNRAEYDEAEEVIKTMIRSIKIGAERTTEIVKGLRSFSRTETEVMQPIDLRQDIDVALLLLQNRIKNQIQVKKKYSEKIPKIYGYSGPLGQAFLNIIGNAVDAVEGMNEAKILISTSYEKGIVSIKVRDNGIGIHPDDLDKIFDPFFTTKKIGEGTGLGLSITYGIIEKHNGNIEVNSIPGEGTEFIIKLPLNDKR